MNEIVFRGPLELLREQALIISDILKNRSLEGFTIFQADEVWLYETEKDNRVCPICEAFGNTQNFSGDVISTVFPYYQYFSSNPFVVYPRVHQPDLSKFFDKECRCTVTLQNPLDCLEEKLHNEKLEGLK